MKKKSIERKKKYRSEISYVNYMAELNKNKLYHYINCNKKLTMNGKEYKSIQAINAMLPYMLNEDIHIKIEPLENIITDSGKTK